MRLLFSKNVLVKIHISIVYSFNRNISSNIDRLTRDIESTRETTEKLRVLNPIGTEDDSSFTTMLTNAQVLVILKFWKIIFHMVLFFLYLVN